MALVRLGRRLQEFAVRRRIKLNRVILVFILVFLAHPKNHIFFGVGFMAGLIGALIRIWSKVIMEPSGGGLPNTGPYRLVRHPMYLGTIAQGLGIWAACLSFGRFFSFCFLGVVLAIYFLVVYREAIVVEEERLAERSPQEWEEYVARTPALIPRKESLTHFSWSDIGQLDFRRLKHSTEGRNFLALLGVFAFLWFKLVYRL